MIAARREERAEDIACAASPEQDVAGGEHGDEVIRGIGVATEVAPEAAPRLVDRRRRQQAGVDLEPWRAARVPDRQDRKSTRLNSSHANISYAVFCLKKKKETQKPSR